MFNHSNIGVFILSEITKFESAPIANISDFVQIKDEQVYTTSRIVAEKFGKRHDHVVEAIEELIKTMPQPIENIRNPKNRVSEYFIPDEYKIEGQTRTYKQYLITEKGAMLLIMGFTGEKAFAIKTKFIDEFARMKNIINNPEQVIANCGNAEAITAYGIQMTKIGRMMTETANNLCLIEKQRDKAEEAKAIAEQERDSVKEAFSRSVVSDNDKLYSTFIKELKMTNPCASSLLKELKIFGKNGHLSDYGDWFKIKVSDNGFPARFVTKLGQEMLIKLFNNNREKMRAINGTYRYIKPQDRFKVIPEIEYM